MLSKAIVTWLTLLPLVAGEQVHGMMEEPEVARDLKEGVNCESEAFATCIIKSTGEACPRVLETTSDDCDESLEIEHTWRFCNTNTDTTIRPNFGKTFLKIRDDKLRPDGILNDLAAGECFEYSESMVFNTCKNNKVSIATKMEGWVPEIGTSFGDGLSNCYAYKFNQIRAKYTEIIDRTECEVEVGIECKVVDKAKYGNTCDEIVVPEDECDKKSLQLRYNFTWCNKMDKSIEGKGDGENPPAFLRVKGVYKDVDWDLAPKQCKWRQFTVKINSCKDTTPAQIQYAGRLDGVPGKPGWCQDFLFLRIPINRPDVLPTPSPSASPTEPVEPCILFITELVDPKTEVGAANKFNSRYVELYSPNCAGKIIRDDLFLTRFVNDNTDPEDDVIDLNGKRIGDDGFLIFCAYSDPDVNGYPDGTCDYEGGLFGPAGSAGDDNVAIIRDPSTKPYDIVDVFGVPGEDGAFTDHDYRKGRATRKTSVDYPKVIWSPDDWFVIPGDTFPREFATIKDADPREWKNPPLELIITEIADPATPTVLKPGGGVVAPRFVEIYSPRTEYCGKNIDVEGLKLLTWKQAKLSPAWAKAIDLYGLKIQDDCFIVICNVDSANSVYDDQCDYIDSVGGTVDSNGDDHIAIVQGEAGDFEILDIFGRPGVDGTGTDHDFTNGRAVRLLNSTQPNNPWVVYNWEVISGGLDASDMDPHQWVGPGTENPSASPRPSAGTVKPTPSPTVSPAPTIDSCESLELIITEVTSPSDDDRVRYVELFSSCVDYTIKDDYFLKIFPEDSEVPIEESAVSLKGVKVPADGFIVICSTDKVDVSYGAGTCDLIAGRSKPLVPSPADSNGDDNIAIMLGSDIVDVFGRPGEDGTNTDHDFTGGRAVRKTSATTPRGSWRPNEWDVFSIITPPKIGAMVEDMDPRVWVDIPMQLIITEVADPADNFKFRFVELFSAMNAGEVIEDFCLARWKSDNSVPSILSLVGMQIKDDGFLVLCPFENANERYDGKCDFVADSFTSATNVRGEDHVAIIKCPDSCDASGGHCIIDMYGNPGNIGIGTKHDFTDGRGVRKTTALRPKKVWDFDDWYVIPGDETPKKSVTSDGMDPRVWEDGSNCDPNFIITELVDPKNNEKGRYLEIYTPDTCIWGETISKPLSVVMWDSPTSISPNFENFIPLSGMRVGDDGFLVLCAYEQANSIYEVDGGSEAICDEIVGIDGPADTDGTKPIAIMEGGLVDGEPKFTVIIDLFAEIGKDCADMRYCFGEGRAVRKRTATSPNYGTPDRSIWMINVPSEVDDCDPGEWVVEEPPEIEPTPSPTVFKGKGTKKPTPGGKQPSGKQPGGKLR